MNDDKSVKICSKCGIEKELNMFAKNKKARSGFGGTCKECRNKLYKPTPEKTKQYKKTYKSKYPDKAKEYARKRREVNGEEIRLKKRLRRKNNPEKRRADERKFRLNHPDYKKRKDKRYRLKNKNQLREKRVTNLPYNYIKDSLKRSGFELEQIKNNPELIEVRRITIKIKRLCKTLQN